MTSEGSGAIADLWAENQALTAALKRLGHPNWTVRPTGEDAREMARYARSALAEISSGGESVTLSFTTDEAHLLADIIEGVALDGAEGGDAELLKTTIAGLRV